MYKLLYTENTTAANKLKAKSKSFPLHATWEVGVQLHLFLNSVLDGGKWSVAHPDHFTPAQEPPTSTEKDARWADDVLWKRNMPETQHRSPSQEHGHYTDWATPAPELKKYRLIKKERGNGKTARYYS